MSIKIAVCRALVVCAALVFTRQSSLALVQEQTAARCRPSGPLVEMRGVSEASGLAVSRRSPGRLWSHNDSGEAVLFAVDTSGSLAGRVHVTGAAVEDWEAIAVGPCDAGSCIYIGDIGDNKAARRSVTIYRLPEPDAASGTVAVSDVFHAAYPDGAHDAEALLVSAEGRLYIVTKGETGPIALYRFPAQLRGGGSMRLERVGAPVKVDSARDTRITDGAISPDGQWAALRTASSVTFYRAADLFAGRWSAVTRVDLSSLKERQGEGIALGAGNTIFLAGEGGGKSRSGTFARFTCAPDQ